ncbi:MAG: F0F1 ATP synthase subunit A [Pseudomonadota bacterium]
MEQFEIHPIGQIELFGMDLSFTNSSLWMVIAAVVSTAFLLFAVRGGSIVPTRLQVAAEMLYDMIAGMVRDNVGSEGRRFFPFIFTLFIFILFCNVLALIPGSFAVTSHIIVTFFMAIVIFITVTAIGFAKHGLHFFRFFFPEGAPLWTAVILIPIEVVSYLSRPISLSVRLFANMTVGHVLFKILAGFVLLMGVAGILPLIALVGITALELLVAVLQAYVFTILTCVYLHDAIHMH